MRGNPPPHVEEILVGSLTEPTPAPLIHSVEAILPLTTGPNEEDRVFTSAGSLPTMFSLPFPTCSGSTRPNSQTDMIFAYFDFLEVETLSHIAPEDIQFLEYKGCFHIPRKPILDDLVREYFLHVHPVLPVLDERLFWEMYIPRGSTAGCKKVPLFVFRAMLFVSCSVGELLGPIFTF
jgi:hypothetical protein